jgi:hypothetical protein
LILRAIQATLAEEMRNEDSVHRDLEQAVSENKRRKLSNVLSQADPLTRDSFVMLKRARMPRTNRALLMREVKCPYAFDECDFRCAQSGNLTIHKRTHTASVRLHATNASIDVQQATLSLLTSVLIPASIRLHAMNELFSLCLCLSLSVSLSVSLYSLSLLIMVSVGLHATNENCMIVPWLYDKHR